MARLILLGPAREVAGCREDVIRAPDVAGVLEQARERYGSAFAELLAHSRVWRNGILARDEDLVTDQDEIAVVPPISGG